MYPGTYAAQAPERVAAVMAGTGETISYGELERRSAQLVHILRDVGLRPDTVALLTENSLRALEVYWAALRSGLYITAVNYRLKPDEVAYIVSDSGAAALIVSAEQAATAMAVRSPAVKLWLAFGGAVPGYGGYEETIAAAPAAPLAHQPHGATMLYSSGPPACLRASGRRCPRSRWTSPPRAWSSWPAWPSASAPTRFTCRRGRSITPRRCASAARPRLWAAPWS